MSEAVPFPEWCARCEHNQWGAVTVASSSSWSHYGQVAGLRCGRGGRGCVLVVALRSRSCGRVAVITLLLLCCHHSSCSHGRGRGRGCGSSCHRRCCCYHRRRHHRTGCLVAGDAMLSIASAAQRACRTPTVTHVKYQAIRGRLGDASLRLYPGHEWWNEMRDAGVDVQVAPTADRYIGTEGATTEPGPGGDPGER
jgi:hypothetical protein